MSTYTQEAKRLVLVATDYDPINSQANPLTKGTIGFQATDGTDILADIQTSNPEKVQIVLASQNVSAFATNPLNLMSEIISKDMVKDLKVKTYQAPYEQAQIIRLSSGTYAAGEEMVLSVYFDGYGSLSYDNTYTKYGAYFVRANSTSAATAAAALVANLNKNLAKDLTPRVTAIVGGADIATAVGTTVILVNGSTAVDLTGAATVAASFAGWVLLGGNLYYATGTIGATGITLNRPAVTSGTGVTVTNTTTADIIIASEPQTVINFQNPWRQITFKTALTVDGETDENISATLNYGANKGSGYGPEVAQIERFAQGQQSNAQWIEYQRMLDEQLNAVTTKSYDTVTFKLETTKTGSGSNVTSVREVQIFVENDGSESATSLYTDFAAWLSA